MTNPNGVSNTNGDVELTLLDYMRSKTQVDLDSLDIDLAKELGPFADCTSNQADSYGAFIEPSRKRLLRSSVEDAQKLIPNLHTQLLVEADEALRDEITVEELGVEIAMTRISLSLIPFIRGRIFVMANPTVANSIPKTVACGRRIAAIAKWYEPGFDLDRLCIKVASTWEGLNACRILKESFKINTLGTTLFTKEQAMLAADAGCIFISPFVHELRVHFDETYSDKDPIFDLCLWAQEYFRHHGFQTKVKACSIIDVDEVLKLAGVDAFTIAPHTLRELAAKKAGAEDPWEASIFHPNNRSAEVYTGKPPFLLSEVEWRAAYAQSDGGKGRLKTVQAIALFSEYQFLAEGVIRDFAKGLST